MNNKSYSTTLKTFFNQDHVKLKKSLPTINAILNEDEVINGIEDKAIEEFVRIYSLEDITNIIREQLSY